MLISHWLKALRNRLHRQARPRVSRKRGSQRIAPKNLTAFVESLEDRMLLSAVGPRLVAITPNTDVFDPAKGFQDGEVLDTAPTQLTIKFSEGQKIDPNSLLGIQVVRSGFDDVFTRDAQGNPADNNPNPVGSVVDDSIAVQIGSIQPGDQPNIVIVRFANTLVDDTYQIRFKGTGNTPLRNDTGAAFNDGADQTFNFQVDRGAQIEAVVQQPIVRDQTLTVTDPSQLSDGSTFTVKAGGKAITFEFDNNGINNADNDNVFAINTSTDTTAAQYAVSIFSALSDAAGVHGNAFGLNFNLSSATITISANNQTTFSPVITPATGAAAGLHIADGALHQRTNFVNVYFNANDPLNLATAESPAFYRLIGTDGTVRLPTSVLYNADSGTATLDFGAPLPVGTFNLEIGESFEGNNQITDGTPMNLGTREVGTTTYRDAYIGGNPNLTSLDPNDVDLYRFELQNPTSINVSVLAANGLNAFARVFDANGNPIALGSAAFNNNDLNPTPINLLLSAGTYYIGVSSQGNQTYNPNNGSGATGGASMGSYRLSLSTGSLAEVVSAGNVADVGGGNNSIANAQALAATSFTNRYNVNVARSTELSHVTVAGNGNGASFDYFSFQANAGDKDIFDIDNAGFDSKLYLFDGDGNLLASNDNATLADPGSASLSDAFLEYTFDTNGTYYIAVADAASTANGGVITGTAPNGAYQLHVSVVEVANVTDAGSGNNSIATAQALAPTSFTNLNNTIVGARQRFPTSRSPATGMD